MIEKILNATGIQKRRGRFTKPPAGTYAVFFDDMESAGADWGNGSGPRIITHNVRLELYEEIPDDVAEATIEAELDNYELLWAKEDRYWLQDAQRYQVIYEFTYIEKK